MQFYIHINLVLINYMYNFNFAALFCTFIWLTDTYTPCYAAPHKPAISTFLPMNRYVPDHALFRKVMLQQRQDSMNTRCQPVKYI